MRKFIGSLLLAVLLLSLFSLPAMAQEDGKDITKWCTVSLPGGAKSREQVLDGYYRTLWQGHKKATSHIKIKVPQGLTAGGIYLSFGELPQSYTLSRGGEVVQQGDTIPYHHFYLPIQAGGEYLLKLKSSDKKAVSLSEIKIFEGETPPKHVQQWQDAPQEVDLMVLVAHPDDELLFMGGAIPHYLHVAGKRVQVVYLTCANNMRRSEMLNGLWTMGVRQYPEIGPFRDITAKSKRALYNVWHEDKVKAWVTEQVRKYKPQVIIGHDVRGEYGHVAHRIASDMVLYAAKAAGQAGKHPESAKKYGAWEVSKAYLHLYKDKKIVMDWKTPIAAMDGQTPDALAHLAFKQHRSQQKNHQMDKNRLYDATLFGLAYSTVGDDVEKNDFFEHVTPR